MPKFKKRPIVVEAIRLTTTFTIDTDRGQAFALPGDWLITGTDNEQYPVANDIFMDIYDPEGDEAEEYLLKVKKWQFED